VCIGSPAELWDSCNFDWLTSANSISTNGGILNLYEIQSNLLSGRLFSSRIAHDPEYYLLLIGAGCEDYDY